MSNYEREVFYVGMSGHIEQRVYLHRKGEACYFTRKYRCYYLVYFEKSDYVLNAIAREKQLKNWRRQWKIELILKHNPSMKDLSSDWDLSEYEGKIFDD